MNSGIQLPTGDPTRTGNADRTPAPFPSTTSGKFERKSKSEYLSESYWKMSVPFAQPVDRGRKVTQLSIEIVGDTVSFAALEKEWEKLLSKSQATIFQTFEWQHTWWKYYGSTSEHQLYIIVFRSGDVVVGIAPFFIQSYSMFHFNIHRKLLLLGSGLGSPRSALLSLERQGPLDYLDIISARGFEEATAEALVTFLESGNHLWDDIELQNIPESSVIYRHVLPLCKGRGLTVLKETEDLCPIIHLTGTTDEFLSSKRRSLRRNLRYVQRGFLENPDYILEDAAKAGNIDGAIQVLSQLHQKRWNATGYPGLFSDPRFGLMIAGVAKALREKGELWLKILRHEGKAIAVNLGFRFNNTMYTYTSGFDHDTGATGNSGAGSALVFLSIIDSIGSGLSTVDLGRGTESYKLTLTSDANRNWRVTMFREEVSAESGRLFLFRTFMLFNRITSRMNCEKTIAGILLREKGAIRGVAGYARYFTKRLMSKRSAPFVSTSGMASESLKKVEAREIPKRPMSPRPSRKS